MKAVFMAFLGAVAAFVLSACGDDGQLKVALAAEFPPFEYIDGTEFAGIDVDLVREIGRRLGREVEIVNMEFDSVVGAVSSGQAHLSASGLTVNQKRAEVLDFTHSYYDANQVVLARKQSAQLNALTHAKNKDDMDAAIDALGPVKLGVLTGTTGAHYANGNQDWGFSGYKRAQVLNFLNSSLLITALENGQVDLAILDETPARAVSRGKDELVIFDVKLTQEKYAMAVKKGDKALLEQVNATLDELKKSGFVDGLIEKYSK